MLAIKYVILEAPNGETFLTLKLRIKDNNSGFKLGSVRLLDPQGVQHFYWIYTASHGKYYFVGEDPTSEVEYTFNITLPKGSAPGIWGIYEIALIDCAENKSVYNFVEIIHFEIIE